MALSTCPACGRESEESATTCEGCGLTVALFEPIRDAISLPESDPRYLEQVRELLEALGEGTSGLDRTAARPAEPLEPEPAPPEPPAGPTGPSGATAPGRPRRRAGSAAPRPGPSSASTPIPPEISERTGDGRGPKLSVAERRRSEIRSDLELAKRRGVDVQTWLDRFTEIGGTAEAAELRRISQEIARALTDSLRMELTTVEERAVPLSQVYMDATLSEELDGARAAIDGSDLAAADARLKAASERLEALAPVWAAVEGLWRQAAAVEGAIHELTGEPADVPEAIQDGRRRAGEGDAAAAEAELAKGLPELVGTMMPILQKDLARRVAEIGRRKSEGARVGPLVNGLKSFHLRLRERDYVEALHLYHQVAAELDGPPPSREG